MPTGNFENPQLMDCEMLKTPKTDYLLTNYEVQKVYQLAWILGLLTLKIQGGVPP